MSSIYDKCDCVIEVPMADTYERIELIDGSIVMIPSLVVAKARKEGVWSDLHIWWSDHCLEQAVLMASP